MSFCRLLAFDRSDQVAAQNHDFFSGRVARMSSAKAVNTEDEDWDF